MNLGYVGLGAMGAPMVKNLLRAGFTVSSCAHRSRTAIEELVDRGLAERETVAQVASHSDVVLTCVFDAEQTNAVLRGPDGVLANMARGGLVVIMSTLEPAYCRDLADEAVPLGITVLDCPVSGLPQGAEAGTLSLMMGGDAADVDRVRQVLEPLGTLYHCGPIGAGQLTKLCNNAMFISNLGLLAEMRELVQANGMDFETFKTVLNASTGRSFVSEHIPLPARVPLRHAMAHNDLTYALETAAKSGVDMPLVQVARDSKIEP